MKDPFYVRYLVAIHYVWIIGFCEYSSVFASQPGHVIIGCIVMLIGICILAYANIRYIHKKYNKDNVC